MTRKFNIYQIGMMIWLFFSAGQAINAEVNYPQGTDKTYLTYVRECMDLLMTHGTDTYGPVNTPILVSILDVESRISPADPLGLDEVHEQPGIEGILQQVLHPAPQLLLENLVQVLDAGIDRVHEVFRYLGEGVFGKHGTFHSFLSLSIRLASFHLQDPPFLSSGQRLAMLPLLLASESCLLTLSHSPQAISNRMPEHCLTAKPRSGLQATRRP